MSRYWLPSLLGELALGGSAAADEPRTLQLAQTIPLVGKAGRFDHLAIDSKGDRLFVANLSNDSLDIVDLKAGKLLRQIPNQKKAQGVAFAPALNRIYQGNGVEGVCSVFDGTSFEKLRAIPLPDADNVRFDPGTGLVYVAHGDKTLTAFDAETYAVKSTIKLPGPPEAFQLDPDRKRLYVNCLNPGTVAVVNLDSHEVIAKYPLTKADACYPMALDVKGRRVFVGCRNEPSVVILDAKTGKEVAAVPIPADIDDLFYDAERDRLYASCGEGVLAALEEKDGAFAVVEEIPTGKLARTSLFDPVSGRLYLPVPRQEGQDHPELRVYEARP